MQSTYMGKWGPGGPAVTSHYYTSLWRPVTDGRLFIPGRVYVAYDTCDLMTVFGSEAAAALYRGLALSYCICAYAEVSLTSWGDRYVCSFNMYVCVCGDAEVSYRNWGDCSYVGTVYVVMLK